MVKYSIRLLANCNNSKNIIFDRLLMTYKRTVALSDAIGLPYASKIWIMNGCIPTIPENVPITISAKTINKGLRVRFCLNSANLFNKVGDGWKHFWFFLIQMLHDFESWLYRWREWNSLATSSLDTQPRKKLSAFSASIVWLFERSHNGVSGICKNGNVLNREMNGKNEDMKNEWKKQSLTKVKAIKVSIDTNMQTSPAVRHGIKVFKINTNNIPTVENMLVYCMKKLW